MRPVFTFLTISGRHALLPALAPAISAVVRPHGIDVRWQVVLSRPQPWAQHIADWDDVLRSLRGTWVLHVSDDNLPHPQVVARWAELLRGSPSARFMHFRQQLGPQEWRDASPQNLDGGRCDGGQILWDADTYNALGWSWDQFGSEGLLFRKAYEMRPQEWVFHNEALTYYNRMRWLCGGHGYDP